MEKLIELLNEYSLRFIENKYLIKWEIWENPIWIYGYVREYWLWWASKLIIISKEFWFIKWLVDNNKIDFQKVMEQNKNWYDITRVNPDDNFIDNAIEYDDELDLFIIMLLSIQDNPIEFLISILK